MNYSGACYQRIIIKRAVMINGDFSEPELPKGTLPPSAPDTLSTGRFIGGIVLIIGLALVLFISINIDAKVIVPHHRSIQATQTAAAPGK